MSQISAVKNLVKRYFFQHPWIVMIGSGTAGGVVLGIFIGGVGIAIFGTAFGLYGPALFGFLGALAGLLLKVGLDNWRAIKSYYSNS